MSPEVMQEPFTLTYGDLTETAGDSATSATVFYDIWLWQVPTGIGLILLPGHTFACYIYSSASAQGTNLHQVRISIMDSSKQDKKSVFGPLLYASCKNFDDRDKMARLNISAPVKVYEKQWVVIEMTGDGTYSVDGTGGTYESYFELAISRVRQPLSK